MLERSSSKWGIGWGNKSKRINKINYTSERYQLSRYSHIRQLKSAFPSKAEAEFPEFERHARYRNDTRRRSAIFTAEGPLG